MCAGTSKGAALPNGHAAEVNMSPETVELKLTVSQAEDVAVAFDIKVTPCTDHSTSPELLKALS